MVMIGDIDKKNGKLRILNMESYQSDRKFRKLKKDFRRTIGQRLHYKLVCNFYILIMDEKVFVLCEN